MANGALSLHRPDQWPEVLSTAQVAQLFATTQAVVRRMIERGDLDAVLVGGLYRIAAESVWPLVPRSIRAQWPEGPWTRAEGNDGQISNAEEI